MATLQEIAKQAADSFERATRDDGSAYVRTKDDAPEWVRDDVVFPAHGDMLPDDWRYETVWLACEWIAENAGNAEDTSGEFADSRVDIYTSALTDWLGSHVTRPGYVDDAREEFGACDDASGILGEIARGQYLEASEVYSLTFAALDARADGEEV